MQTSWELTVAHADLASVVDCFDTCHFQGSSELTCSESEASNLIFRLLSSSQVQPMLNAEV